jgi:hypothetical protein
MAIWRMRTAYSIPKATNTHSEYAITYYLVTQIMVTRTHLNIPLYALRLSRHHLRKKYDLHFMQ